MPPLAEKGPVDAAGVLDRLADAVVVADATGTILMVNQAAVRMFGTRAADLLGRPVSTLVPRRLRSAHTAGFERYVATGRSGIVGGPPLRVSARRADGYEVPVELTLSSIADTPGHGQVVVATLRDMSERVVLERQAVLSRLLQASVDASRDGVLAVSPERRVLAVNRRFCELWNLPPDSVRPGDASPALAEASRSRVVDPEAFEAAIRWGHAHPEQTQTLDVALVDGRVLEGYSAPIVDDDGVYHGRVWYLHDDTERRATAARLGAAERAQRFLLDASAVITRASGYAQTLRSLAAVAVPVLGDLCLIDVIDECGELTRIASVHAEPGSQSLADELAAYPPDPAGEHPSAQTIRDGRSRFSGEMSDEFLAATTHDESHLSILRRLGFTSYMTVPLLAEGEVLGAVTMVSAGSGRRFGPDDLALVEDLAARAAAVVVKERRSDSQRRLSHGLQASLLPAHPPKLGGLEVAVRYLPGTGDVEVGGDFWDLAELADGTIGLAVGDVEGHDMTAAAAMAQLRSVLRALRAQSSGPDELISLIHDAWDQLGTERMATACCVRLYPGSGTLRVCLAGHPPPLLIDRPGHAVYLDVEPCPPFGTIRTAPAMAESPWPIGGVVVLFTDGLVEGRGRPITEGMNLLMEAVANAVDLDPESLADRILEMATGPDRHDDIALLVARRLDPGSMLDGRDGDGGPGGESAAVSSGFRFESISLPGEPASAAEARAFVRRKRSAWRADTVLEPALAVVSELVANVVVHAKTGMTISLSLGPDVLRVEATDGTPQMPLQRHDPGATTGRGLWLVAALSREWGTELRPGGKVVWSEITSDRTRP